MDQRAGDVSFLDGRVQLLRLATADAGDEIREMIAARLPMRAGVLVAAEPAFIAESVLIAFGQVSVRSVKDVTDRVVAIEQAVAEAGFVVRDPMPDFELHHLAMTVGLIEFKRAIEGVRRLLVVIEHEVAADGGDPTRESDAEPPPRDVDLVYPLIANVSVPCLPDPVSVVMKAVAGERLQRCRSRPEVIVDSLGNGFGRCSSNRVPSLEAQPPRQVDFAKGAFVQVVDRLDLRASRAALRAVLHDAAVLLGGAHELASFPQVVRAWLLDVDVFARLARPDRHQRVPMVRRR